MKSLLDYSSITSQLPDKEWSAWISSTAHHRRQQCVAAAQHSMAQHSTAWGSPAQHGAAQHSTVQHGTAQHSCRLCPQQPQHWMPHTDKQIIDKPAGRLSCLPSLCRALVTDSPGIRMAAMSRCRAAVCGFDISGASSAAAMRRCLSRICCRTVSLTTAAESTQNCQMCSICRWSATCKHCVDQLSAVGNVRCECHWH